MQILFRFILLFILSINYLNGEIVLDDNSQDIVVLKNSEIYLDVTDKYTIDKVINNPKLFKKYNKEFINYGLDNKKPLWVKFTLFNNTDKIQKRTLSVDNIQIENIEFYVVKENKVIEQHISGSLHLKEFNGILMPNFDLEVASNSKVDYYLKVSTPSYGLSFKLLITTYERFLSLDINKHLILAIFVAILIAVFFYNFFLYFLTKDSIYFFYSLYILGILATKKVHYILWLHLFPMHELEVVELETSLIVYYTNFMSLTMILFTQKFLKTQSYPRLHKFLNFLIIIVLVHSLVTTSTFLTYQDVAAFYMLLLVFFFFVGFYALYKKNKNALYFVFGWGLSIFAWLTILLDGLNILNTKYEFFYITELFIMLEVFLFSFAISKYIKEISNQKEQLSQKLVEQKENENIRLEKVVEEKTAYLNAELKTNTFLLQELNHRVKNNMQFITSLYALKLESDDIETQKKLQDVERKVYAMSQVHQMLYSQKDLAHIEANNYFEKIVKSIKDSFNLEGITFIYNIDVTLELEEAIYCGLIVNELVTNAVKYAFPDNVGEIIITLSQDENNKYLKVKDNGIGISEDVKNGFGYMLIETLTTEQLNGKLAIEKDDGTTIVITLPKHKIINENII